MDLLVRAETEARAESVTVSNMFSTAYNLAVTTHPEAEVAAAQRKDVKSYFKRIEDLRKSLVGPLNDTVKKINELFKPAGELATKTDKLLGDKLAAYHTEQENKLRLQEAKDREAADKERAKLDAQALRLAEKGKTDQAVAKREEAEAVPTPVLAPPEKIAGTYFREEWVYEILNEAEVENQYKMLDHPKIGKIVKATKGTLPMRGIRQYSKKIPVDR